MADLKKTICENLVFLRLRAGLKQSELAEKIHYSDKSVSKWERGDAVPDVAVLVALSAIYGVTLDDLVHPHEEWVCPKEWNTEKPKARHRVILAVTIVGIWLLALVTFIVLWLCGKILWLLFTAAVPVSLLTVLVLHSVWEGGRYNFWVLSALIISLLFLLYTIFWNRDWWQLFLLIGPIELLLFLVFRIRRKP